MRALRHIVPAVLAIAAGAALWGGGDLERRGLAARQELLLMRYELPLDTYDAVERATRFVPSVGAVARWRRELRTRRAESQYWLADYAGLTTSERGDAGAGARDPALIMIVANAAYRQVAADLTDPAAPERLEQIAGLYLDVLETDPALVDAAYNYEFVLRARDSLAQGPTAKPRGRAQAATADPQPSPAGSVHGVPGVAPPDADMGNFKIIVPQGPDDRQQQPDAGVGGAKVRKG